DPAVLTEYLALTRDAGLRLPDERLPDLFGIAARTTSLRPAILALAGPRGAWLAANVPEIAAALPDLVATPRRGPVGADGAIDAGAVAADSAPADSAAAATAESAAEDATRQPDAPT